MMSQKPLVLVDGSSYFFRAFHALPPLTNSKGQPTGAVYGVTNMIKRLIKDFQPEYLAVVFDDKGKTFRDDWYPEYKAHRPPMPPELSGQFQPLLDVLQAMGLPLLIVPGVEADDVIGTLAQQAMAENMPVIISTGDKDMAQLVNEQVTLINTMSNQTLTIQGVKDKFGVWPSQIIDYLTLMGDTSDNIPGVQKCGPKTAVKWLEQYETLENVVKHAVDISGKVGENLRAFLPELALSKKLVTIKTDVVLPLMLDDLKPKSADKPQLIHLCQTYEFKTWLKELLSEQEEVLVSETTEEKPVEYELIHTPEQWAIWLKKLQESTQFCIDTETTSIDALQAELVGISLAFDSGLPAYIPLAHVESGPQLDKAMVLNTLKPILENPSILKIGQNLKYDTAIFKNEGIDLQGIAYDTMLESYVLNSTAARHDMDSLALKYLGYKTITFKDVAGVGAKQLRFDQIPIEKAAPYAAEDAQVTMRLHQTLYPMMDEALRRVFHDIEIPLLPVIVAMERQGVLIDLPTLEKQGVRLKARMEILEKEAIELAGKPFNVNSPKQLQEILFGDLKLPILSKTPTGQPSTAEDVLQELAFDYRLPAVILEYRGLNKLVSTYIDALPRRINPHTGRVHTCYNQAVAATGRLSSSDPNLQNIPIRHEEGRMIRQAFIAPPGYKLVAADYSQIELRIMAHLSQDPNLLFAFSKGYDIHTATASEIFGVSLTEVTTEQRRRAKAVNFGLIYGMSAFGLAKQIGVSREDAKLYMDRYFQRYPGVLAYMERTRQQAHEQGFVETLYGRRLHLPEISSRNMMRRRAAERTAINAPMQGTAADIIKKAMLAYHAWHTTQTNPCATMIMQVHDELVFEVDASAISDFQVIIRDIMQSAVQLSVPLIVTVGAGDHWDEAH